MNSTSTITAIAMHNSNTITYSMNPDKYEFRQIIKKGKFWVEITTGPMIDRVVD